MSLENKSGYLTPQIIKGALIYQGEEVKNMSDSIDAINYIDFIEKFC